MQVKRLQVHVFLKDVIEQPVTQQGDEGNSCLRRNRRGFTSGLGCAKLSHWRGSSVQLSDQISMRILVMIEFYIPKVDHDRLLAEEMFLRIGCKSINCPESLCYRVVPRQGHFNLIDQRKQFLVIVVDHLIANAKRVAPLQSNDSPPENRLLRVSCHEFGDIGHGATTF